MKNPCGKWSGAKNPVTKSSGGKLTRVLGRRGTTQKFITGK
jgi:hypothetical protein